jgi:hypothetical protein
VNPAAKKKQHFLAPTAQLGGSVGMLLGGRRTQQQTIDGSGEGDG